MCGRSIGGNTTSKQDRRCYYYGCSDRYSTTQACPHCTFYPAAQIHAVVRDALQAAYDSPDSLPELVQLPTPVGPDLAAMSTAIDRKLSRLEAAYDAGAYTAPEYADRRAALKLERQALSLLEVPTAPAPADVTQVRAATQHALGCADLLEVVEALNLRGVLGPGGELTLSMNPL